MPNSRTKRDRVQKAKSKEPLEYEVEAILEKRVTIDGQVKYLIKWLGYEETSWEPEENCDCPDMLNKFEEKVTKALIRKGKPGPSSAMDSSDTEEEQDEIYWDPHDIAKALAESKKEIPKSIPQKRTSNRLSRT